MRTKIFNVAILVIALIGFSANSLSAQTITDAEMVERAEMERQVRKEILSLPYYGVFDAIGYEIKGDTVLLNGYVVRPYTKKEAAEAVLDIEGVSRVENSIEVLPPSPSDDRIRVRIYREIANKGNLYRYLLGANPSIRIVVKNGRVILEGIVTYESDITLATTAASQTFGVFNVENNLKLERREGEEVS